MINDKPASARKCLLVVSDSGLKAGHPCSFNMARIRGYNTSIDSVHRCVFGPGPTNPPMQAVEDRKKGQEESFSLKKIGRDNTCLTGTPHYWKDSSTDRRMIDDQSDKRMCAQCSKL